MKLYQTARFTAAVGVNGVGFVMFNPCYIANNHTGNYTDATYAGTEATVLSGATPGVAQFATIGNPVSAAGSAYMARHVLTAIRIRYIGTELNRGGTITRWIDKEDQDVLGMTIQEVKLRPRARVDRVMEGWSQLVLVDSGPEVTDFSNEFVTYAAQKRSDVISGNQRRPMLIALSGVPGNQFQVEVVTYLETRFNLFQQMWTKTHVDPVGTPAVIEAVNEDGGQGNPGTILERLEQAIKMGTRVVDVTGSIADYGVKGAATLSKMNMLLGSLGINGHTQGMLEL